MYPQGKGREIPGGNQRRRSAAGEIPAPQAPTKEGLAAQRRCRAVVGESTLSPLHGLWAVQGWGRIMEVSATVDAGFALVLMVSLSFSVARRTSTGTVDCCLGARVLDS